MTQLGPLGAAAQRMAAFGWFVFPVAAKGKVPVTTNGLDDATRDLDLIESWWLRHPDHNIGLRCGVESGIVVVDVDHGKDGFESLRQLEKEYGLLPDTLSVVTPGGGQHYYFRWPGVEIDNTVGFPGAGLDIRGSGGLVVAPPSVGANGRRYEVDAAVPLASMPEWLVTLLSERQTAPRSRTDPSVWASMLRDGIPDGGRNDGLARMTGHLLRRYVDVDFVAELMHLVNRHRCQPPKPADEVDKIIDSIAGREARRRRTG